MKDFVSIDVASTLSKTEMLTIFSRELPEFSWRTGDSDAQGGYVSGLSADKVQIQIWTDEKPMEMFITFRLAKSGVERKQQVFDQVHHCLSYVGEITKCDA